MTSRKLKQLVSADEALKTLEAALEEEWNDENLDTSTDLSLPLKLSDATACLEWGRSVLARGLQFPAVATDESQEDDEEFRMVARNGVAIPQHIKERMHVERLAAEHDGEPDINVED